MKVTEIIDKVIDHKSETKHKSKPAFKPSALGSPCLRKIYYSFNRVPEDYDMQLSVKRICRLGDAIHDMLGSCLRKAGVLIDYHQKNGKIPVSKHTGEPDPEFPLKDDFLKISAKIDAVMNINGQLWLGEWKSINDYGFRKLSAPKPEHLIQGAVYLYVFNKALQDGKYNHIKALKGFTAAEGVKFVYVNKNTSVMKEYSVTDAQEVFAHTISKMKTVEDFIERSELPPGTEDWCKSCPWRDKCAKNYKI